MRIYTKKGDDGTTGLFYGGRVSKSDPGPEAYGTVDEAVSALGVARAAVADDAMADEITEAVAAANFARWNASNTMEIERMSAIVRFCSSIRCAARRAIAARRPMGPSPATRQRRLWRNQNRMLWWKRL